MAAGYGCEVGDDVIFTMKWMGMNQAFIAWFSSLSSRQEDKTRGIACLANTIVLAMFLGDSLVNGEAFFAAGGMPLDGLYFNIISFGILILLSFGGWAAEGFPMPSLGAANGQPLCMTFNTLLCVIFGLLFIFKKDLLRETFLTKEDGTLAEYQKDNSKHFIFEMWKWIGMMKIGEALRNEFMFGTKDGDAKYQTLRAVALQWALHAGALVFMDFAHPQVGFPYTKQTQYINFVMNFGMFYFCMYTLVHTPYPKGKGKVKGGE